MFIFMSYTLKTSVMGSLNASEKNITYHFNISVDSTNYVILVFCNNKFSIIALIANHKNVVLRGVGLQNSASELLWTKCAPEFVFVLFLFLLLLFFCIILLFLVCFLFIFCLKNMSKMCCQDCCLFGSYVVGTWAFSV